MTRRETPEPHGSQTHSGLSAARRFECAAVVIAGVAITLRPIIPGHAMTSSINLLLHALIVTAGFLWLAAQCLYGSVRVGRSGIGIPLIVYALVVGITPVFAAYKFAALRSLPIWLTNLLLFFLVFNFSRDRHARKFFIAVLLAAAAVVVFQGIYQRVEGLEEARRQAEQENFLEQFHSATDRELAMVRLAGNEPFASFITSNILATFLLTTLPVFFGAGIESLRNSAKTASLPRATVLFLAGGAGLVCLYLTGSLAGWIVCAGEVLIFILILSKRWIAKHWQVCTVFIAAAALALAVFGPPLIRRIAEVRSVNYRLGYWAGSQGVFTEHWLTGVGLENFQWSYTAHKLPWAGEVMYPHNSLIQSATEFGVIGLAAFAAVWVLFVVRILRIKTPGESGELRPEDRPEIMPRRRLLPAGCITLVVLFGVLVWYQPFGNIGQVFSRGMIYVVAAALAWGLVFSACALAGARGERRFLHTALAVGALGFLMHSMFDFAIYSYGANQACWVVAALALATVAGGVKFTSRRMSAFTRLSLMLTGCMVLAFYVFGPVATALREERMFEYAGGTDSVVAMKRAPDLNVHNTETLRLLAGNYYREYRELRRLGDKSDLRMAEMGVQRMREAIRLNPNDFALHIETAIMLRGIGRKAEALEEYNRAVELYPTRPSLRIYRAELLDKMGRRNDARKDIKEIERLLRLNKMPDGSIRHKTLELDTVKGLPGLGSEKKMFDALRKEYRIGETG